jgi:chemotaxis protein MotA
MDIATIIGFVLGIFLLYMAVGDQVMLFVDMPSIYIVVGGAVAATLISLPLDVFMTFLKVIKNSFFSPKVQVKSIVNDIVRYGEIARRDGILALEGIIGEVKDPFLKKGIQLAVDGSDPEAIGQALGAEISAMAERHAIGKKILDTIGKYGPAFGMIGTLVGLILMLANLSDPSSIAPNMAVALITTLYGALLSNLFCTPIADKLDVRNGEEIRRMNLVVAGVTCIQSGDNPRVVEQKLQVFLKPKERTAA